MEPGHEGREEVSNFEPLAYRKQTPQWSPAMKAGKRFRLAIGIGASMSGRNGARP